MPDLSTMRLTFDDEFDTRSISQTGATTRWSDIRNEWRLDANSDIGFGRSSFLDASSGYDPFKVANGTLTITAQPDRTSSGDTGSWESGIITTQNGFSQTYGYFEMRADLSNSPGGWDAFWLLPDHAAANPQNLSGHQEIDIFEHYGDDDSSIYSTIHTTDPLPAGATWQNNLQVVTTESNPSGFHTYGLLWTPDTLDFYVDGNLVGSKPTPSDMHGPMYILADLATTVASASDAGTKSMVIDYIRAYALPGPAPTAAWHQDFNGDGHSDILWRNDNGDFSTWQVNGAQLTPNAYADASVGPDWHVAETFDFNGDGLSDILWRNATTGTFTIWEGKAGGGFTENAYVNGTVSTDWQIAGTGDWNGDGKDDIVWRNEHTGALTIWSSTGSGFTANAYADGVPLNWQIVGLGDFNGDGKADLLWRDQTTGKFVDWLSTGTGFQHDAYSDSSVNLNWHVAGIGDFDGDGKDDILWRNASSGGFTIWSSTGTGFTPNTYGDGSVGPDWQIAQIGDFNGDARADILWRNTTTGTFTTWQSNGHGFDENVAVQGGVGTDWHVQSHDYLYG